MTNRWLYSLIAFGVLLALGIGVYAYQANMQEGDPPVMGHSAGEIHVNISGTIKTLQEAIDAEDFKTEMEHVSGGLYGYCVWIPGRVTFSLNTSSENTAIST